MAGRSVSKIPFPSKDPRYMKVWMRMKKGDTLEEALADIDITRPCVRKKTGKGPTGNGKVQGKDLLKHPDVPDEVKDKIRAAQGSTLPGTSATSPDIKNHQHVDNMSPDPHPNKSQSITIQFDTSGLEDILADYVRKIQDAIPPVPPVTTAELAPAPAPVDLSPLLTAIDQVNIHLAEISGKSAPTQDLAPVLAVMAETNKKIDKITVILGAISREVTTIAQTVMPGAVGHVVLPDPPSPPDLHGPIIPPVEKPKVFAKQIRSDHGVRIYGRVEVLDTRGELIRVKDLSDRESQPRWMEIRNFEIEKTGATA